MKAPKIKFCGITREQDAEMAVSLDAWAVGMIMWPHSPRAVPLDRAAGLAASLKRRAEIVGVFVNPTLDEVTATADAVGLTMLQLHGEEGPSATSASRPHTPHRLQGDQGGPRAEPRRHPGAVRLPHGLPLV